MGNTSYRVIITGEILDNFTTSQVITDAAKLFKCNPAQAQKFFTGKPVPLKKLMDQNTAKRYQRRLAVSGIASRLEAATPDSSPALRTKPKGIPPAPPAPAIPLSAKDETIRKLTDADSPLSLVDDAPAEQKATKTPAVAPRVSSESPATPATAQLTQPVVSPAAAPDQMTCPNCATSQPRGNKCTRCGIVFSKFKDPASLPQTHQDVTEEGEETDDWEEITQFVGGNIEPYRNKFRELYNNGDAYVLQWHWPAFFIPVPWLIYRKMYIFAIGYLALLSASSFFPLLLLPLVLGPGLMGNFAYYRHAIGRIDNFMSTGDERRQDIQQAGGTNSMLVTIGISIAASILLSVIYYMIFFKPLMDDAIRLAESDLEEIRSAQTPADQQTQVKMLLMKNAIIMQDKVSEASNANFIMPTSMDELQDILHLPESSTNDAWGTRMKFSVEGTTLHFESAGPDREFDTDDDISYEDEND